MGRECGDKTCADLVNVVIIVIIALVREVNQSKCLPGVKRIFVLPVPRLAAFRPHPPACQPARYESMHMRQQCNPGACASALVGAGHRASTGGGVLKQTLRIEFVVTHEPTPSTHERRPCGSPRRSLPSRCAQRSGPFVGPALIAIFTNYLFGSGCAGKASVTNWGAHGAHIARSACSVCSWHANRTADKDRGINVTF